MTPLLEIGKLSISFPGLEAVRGFDLSIHAGETLALVGESGCGKSVTALSLMRLLPPPARVDGSILFEGRDLLALSLAEVRDLRGRAISMIFQEPMTSLNPVLSIGHQLEEVLRRHEKLSARAARTRAVELLDLVRIPEPARRIDDFAHNLSGGQRQRVMIAMAVACRPRLLIADEPTTALDVTIQAQILELLDRLRREFSMSLLLITHDLGLVGQWADRVAVMYAGRKVEEAATQRLFEHPAHPYSRGLLATSLHLEQELHYRSMRLPEIRHEAGDAGESTFRLIEASPQRIPLPPPADTPILSLREVRACYRTPRGDFAAVDGVSLDILRGQTIGLVGESGCGKTTLSKTILRLLEPAGGTILLDGQDITHLAENRLRPLRSKVQMIFQDPFASLNPRHSIETILDSVLSVHGLRDRAGRRARILETLDHVGLPRQSLLRYPHEFSGGQRQRIGIARALILKPSLVICDEPVSALDVSIQAQILNLLVELKRDFGLSYLFISHDLSVVRYIADEVFVMLGGRFVEHGDHRRIWDAPRHDYTRTLIEAAPARKAGAPASRLELAAA
ncbi:MAG: ABC transporter ATP-binding protein [Candidatus Accumulibacter sp.]|jgi:peptide/nickel transport system ATP-binding protein|nr:ABC transporter ATP-binding protein [Accumulibacter sp.]